MYKRFFGFKERPFRLVPDPAYLYMSRSHEEAMAHLTYAVSQGDGFVEITGEVGTGKTTLCRAFLESLDANTEAAYIFNPKLDSVQLLQAINDEFGIPSDATSIKTLIDTFNQFLIEKKTEGKRVVLVVDEAQNLSKEVLEQLRLLSNLETTKDKLLQIVLVGQPELGELLDSYELRQLGQRISLSCHIVPLSFKETREYIKHRITISSQKPAMRFNRGALRLIYKFSRGIPRLINMICDRSLLIAFGLNRRCITGSIVTLSAKELSGKKNIKSSALLEGRSGVAILVLLCITLAVIILDRLDVVSLHSRGKPTEPEPSRLVLPLAPERRGVPGFITEQIPPAENRVAETGQDATERVPTAVVVPSGAEKRSQEVKTDFRHPGSEPEPGLSPEAAKEAGSFRDLMDFLNSAEPRESRREAIAIALMRWGGQGEIRPNLDGVNKVDVFFRLAANQHGLSLHRLQSDLDTVFRLNLPAVFELHPDRRQGPIYLCLTTVDHEKITLSGGKTRRSFAITREELSPLWSGVAFIPWKNFMAFEGIVPLNVSVEDILALKVHLREIGFEEIALTPFYDERTESAIRALQKKYGIPVDGFVGPLTKIVLYNENRSLKIPHLQE